MAEEYLDILDEEGKPIGQSCTYNDAHKKGLIHKAVHVWIMNSNKQILLQKRALDRQAYPNYWDISASGHVSSGQTSIEGAQMETREETGLLLSSEDFSYLFTLREHKVLNEGTYISNEFQDVYLVKIDTELAKMYHDEEVAELLWIDISEFEEWIKGEGEPLVPHEEEYLRLLECIK